MQFPTYIAFQNSVERIYLFNDVEQVVGHTVYLMAIQYLLFLSHQELIKMDCLYLMKTLKLIKKT